MYKKITSCTRAHGLTYGKTYDVLFESDNSVTVVCDYGYGLAFHKDLFRELANMDKLIFKEMDYIDVMIGNMPDRLSFSGVWCIDPDKNQLWYMAVRESDDNRKWHWVTVDWILKHGRDHTGAKVYMRKDIRQMYADGWRWKANIHVKKLNTVNVMIDPGYWNYSICTHDAYYPSGTKKKWHKGIWVKYNNPFKGEFRGLQVYDIGGNK